VGLWQGQGRSLHITKVRIAIQLLAVERFVLHVLPVCRAAGDDLSNSNKKTE
jgi:hypothetical protein